MRRFVSTVIVLCLCATASAPAQKPVRRQAVTPEAERTAFADPGARTLLLRAREARLAQDSALRAYRGNSYLRLSLGLGVRAIGRERLLLRTEEAWRVRWARGAGILVEPTGRRSAFPMGEASIDLSQAAPIPYFPGREALWIPSSKMGVVQSEVNEAELLHPLATGAEAYYRFASGDSIEIRLPDGRPIKLRELRITARKPDWRAFVGSFWFDAERGSLVRAAYRLSTDIDLWQLAEEENRRTIDSLLERARTDTGKLGRAAKREADRQHMGIRDRIGFNIVRGMFRPARAKLSAVTVEYGLYSGRFWLPKINIAEGEIQAGFVRLPLRWQESFRYDDVNGTDTLLAVQMAEANLAPDDSSAFLVAGQVSIGGESRRDSAGKTLNERQEERIARFTRAADSLTAEAGRARAKGDTALARQQTQTAKFYDRLAKQLIRRREGCLHDSTYFAGMATRYEGALRVAVRLPCDESRLASSPDLPGTLFDPGEELFGSTERDQLLQSLGFSLQPGWGPQKPVVLTGPGLMRYNRIEGLSAGVSVTSNLGLGYVAEAETRIGTGDWVPNGELSLTRSNGRSDVRLGVFHRLGVANDDWGAPLSRSASLANLLYARDEGFYYRTWGAELGGTRDAPAVLGGASLQWRLFAERQRSAGVEPNTQASFGNLFANPRFERNIDAVSLTALGAGSEIARSFGVNPRTLRLTTRLRAEGAFTQREDSLGSAGYGRFVLDATASRPVGPLALSLTGAAGTSAGQLPVQRAFFIGGLQTVRGQFARAESVAGEGRVGDAFWLGRGEVGLRWLAVRPAVFYDVGWAGSRADFTRAGRPLSGAGMGLSFLDGLFRLDVSRGIWPEKRWRTDLYLDARF